MAGDFELAKQRLPSIPPILAGPSVLNESTFDGTRRQWLEIAIGFEHAVICRAEGLKEVALAKLGELLSRFAVQLRQPECRAD